MPLKSELFMLCSNTTGYTIINSTDYCYRSTYLQNLVRFRSVFWKNCAFSFQKLL